MLSLRTLLSMVALAAAPLLAFGGSAAQELEIIDIPSERNFADTVQHLEWQFGGYGMTVSEAIDYRPIVKKLELLAPDAVVFEVIRPPWVEAIFKRHVHAGIVLPLRIYVFKGKDGTLVRYFRPSSMLAASSGSALADLGRDLDEKVHAVVERATGASVNFEQGISR